MTSVLSNPMKILVPALYIFLVRIFLPQTYLTTPAPYHLCVALLCICELCSISTIARIPGAAIFLSVDNFSRM